MILKMLLSVLLLVISTVVGAQERDTRDSAAVPGYSHWRPASVDMSPDEYKQAYRENRRFLLRIFKSHATTTLVSLGASEKGIGMLGAAAALALDHEMKLPLNRSRRLAMHFSDMAQEERAVQIGYTLRW